MNLIALNALEREFLETIIDTSMMVKRNPGQYAEVLKNKTLYMLFEKTSTRTAVAFALGIAELGGRYFTQKWQDSNFVVAEIADETRYITRNVDAILARLKRNKDIEAMAGVSSIPVINGCCNKYHPTQALADCMTVKEHFGTYAKTMLFIGVWNNVFNSLLASFPRLGGRLIGVCPIVNDAAISDEEFKEVILTTKNFEFYGREEITYQKLQELVAVADIIYTDTWLDMEFFNDPAFTRERNERVAIMKPFSVTSALLEDSRAVIMHDMPIHPGYEIERDVVERHLGLILDQAENRRHTAKGILMHLLGVQV